MVFKSNSIPNKAIEKKEIAEGEFRLDKEGKGYWHSFKKKEKPIEEPKVEEPIEEKKSKKIKKKK